MAEEISPIEAEAYWARLIKQERQKQNTCSHKWETLKDGATYCDLKCKLCGKTERRSWD